MAKESGGRPLQFSPFASHVHPGFWSAFSKKKLEEMQLSEEPVPLNGQFVNREQKDLDLMTSGSQSVFMANS